MGKRGPKKTPTATLKLSDSQLLYERQGEPQGPTGTPVPPDWLCPEAKEKWDEVVPLLDQMGGGNCSRLPWVQVPSCRSGVSCRTGPSSFRFAPTG